MRQIVGKPSLSRFVDAPTDLSEIEVALREEEDRLRHIFSSATLRPFVRRVEYWDLLIRIIEIRNDKSTGLNDIASLSRYGTMHHHSLTKFVREQVAAGNFYIEEGDRRDKKIVRANDELIMDFLAISRKR